MTSAPSRLRRVRALAVAAALSAGAGGVGVGQAAEAAPLERPVPVVTSASVPVAPLAAGRVLPQPAEGAEAVARVGVRLPEVAARNGMAPTELARVLAEDPSTRLDVHGALFYVDEGLHAEEQHAEEQHAEGAATDPSEPAVEQAAYPADQTFALHSKPGAPRVIHLDFDGGVVAGTAWNTSYPGIGTAEQPAFDLDGDPATFGPAEHDLVQSVFQRVAEDFAPFDVDVTTQDPGAEAIRRSSSTDPQYGTRVLITPSGQAQGAICPGGCGGVAYIGTVDMIEPYHTPYQPAWVFPHLLGGTAKSIAEAASHEAGHNLGLHHDGTATAGYYTGHGAWAPIMGVGYSRPVTQWSSGEYPGASNGQDDLAVIQANGLPLRADDHGDTTAAATALGAGVTATATGVVTTREDRDVFAVSVCGGSVSASVAPAATSPDLDARLRLLDASGGVLAEADPTSSPLSRDSAAGLSAELSAPVADGTFYLEVDGVGALDPTAGYSDYGSLGAYTLTSTGCEVRTVSPPAAPMIGTAGPGIVGGEVTATARWSPPVDDGGSKVTGYVVTARQLNSAGQVVSTTISAWQPPGARSLSMPLPAKGNYRFLVRALNAAGKSALSERSNLVAGR